MFFLEASDWELWFGFLHLKTSVLVTLRTVRGRDLTDQEAWCPREKVQPSIHPSLLFLLGVLSAEKVHPSIHPPISPSLPLQISSQSAESTPAFHKIAKILVIGSKQLSAQSVGQHLPRLQMFFVSMFVFVTSILVAFTVKQVVRPIRCLYKKYRPFSCCKQHIYSWYSCSDIFAIISWWWDLFSRIIAALWVQMCNWFLVFRILVYITSKKHDLTYCFFIVNDKALPS